MRKRELERHELKYGPHFTESCSEWAVSCMLNEDGTKGAHWDLEQTTDVAKQYDVDLSNGKYNKYDWYVALNMVYSDFYKTVINMTNSNHVKHFIDLAKAWLDDKDIDEGKMWYYYKYVMLDLYHEDLEEEEYDEEEYYPIHSRRRMMYKPHHHREMYDEDDDEEYYEPKRKINKRKSIY